MSWLSHAVGQYNRGLGNFWTNVGQQVGLTKPKPITTTTQLDPSTQKYVDEILKLFQGGAGGIGGFDPNSQQALNFYSQAGTTGATGLAALGGDTAAFAKFQNPYQQDVLNALDPFFAKSRAGAINDINDYFTKAGAFGGSRQGVATGTALADIANTENQTRAGFTYQGFQDAMQRAVQAAGLGFGGAGGLSSLGPLAQLMQNPELRKALLLKLGLGGLPYGQSTTQPVNQNSLANIAGIIALISGFGGFGAGGGAGAGAGAGAAGTAGAGATGGSFYGVH